MQKHKKAALQLPATRTTLLIKLGTSTLIRKGAFLLLD